MKTFRHIIIAFRLAKLTARCAIRLAKMHAFIVLTTVY